MIKKFTIVRDLEWGEDGEIVTLYDEQGNVVMSGDEYHNKIDSKIEGFFEGLDYLEIPNSVETKVINDND
ncbi:hypothetical protein WD019_02345 [Fictibacillus sp. Mic-4]|uniref:hypothetical protein n=1 Tax=Fictibacillus sp. Mic-4 TaxID=3132826 RepID=UPI003CF6FBCD